MCGKESVQGLILNRDEQKFWVPGPRLRTNPDPDPTQLGPKKKTWLHAVSSLCSIFSDSIRGGHPYNRFRVLVHGGIGSGIRHPVCGVVFSICEVVRCPKYN